MFKPGSSSRECEQKLAGGVGTGDRQWRAHLMQWRHGRVLGGWALGMSLSLISGCTLRLTECCLEHLRREVKSVKMLGWAWRRDRSNTSKKADEGGEPEYNICLGFDYFEDGLVDSWYLSFLLVSDTIFLLFWALDFMGKLKKNWMAPWLLCEVACVWICPVRVFVCFETRFRISQAGLHLALYLRLIFNLWPFFSTSIAGFVQGPLCQLQ